MITFQEFEKNCLAEEYISQTKYVLVYKHPQSETRISFHIMSKYCYSFIEYNFTKEDTLFFISNDISFERNGYGEEETYVVYFRNQKCLHTKTSLEMAFDFVQKYRPERKEWRFI